jgi:hypothetical protein
VPLVPSRLQPVYIVADDVTTTGSSLAAFRDYIEGRGGRVVAGTTLAATFSPKNGYSGNIALCRPEGGVYNSVPEVTDTGEDHCHLAFVGSGDRFFVADRTARLNRGGRSGFGGGD